jgi:hypothetical protein
MRSSLQAFLARGNSRGPDILTKLSRMILDRDTIVLLLEPYVKDQYLQPSLSYRHPLSSKEQAALGDFDIGLSYEGMARLITGE